MTSEQIKEKLYGEDIHLRTPILFKEICKALQERDEYALLIFQPAGETHHNANECPYCKENLNKSKQWQDPYKDKMYEHD